MGVSKADLKIAVNDVCRKLSCSDTQWVVRRQDRLITAFSDSVDRSDYSVLLSTCHVIISAFLSGKHSLYHINK